MSSQPVYGRVITGPGYSEQPPPKQSVQLVMIDYTPGDTHAVSYISGWAGSLFPNMLSHQNKGEATVEGQVEAVWRG